jgi:hypothetical protein
MRRSLAGATSRDGQTVPTQVGNGIGQPLSGNLVS